MRDVVVVECPVCGEIRVPTSDVTVSVFPNGATYSFSCPRCDKRTVRDCPPKIVHLLEGLDVRKLRITLPNRVPLDLPPITADEVMDAVVALRDPDFLDELA